MISFPARPLIRWSNYSFALGSPRQEIREAAIDLLSTMPEKDIVLAGAAQLLRNGNSVEKRNCIQVLDRISEDTSTASAIASCLSDKDKWVRREAETALINMGARSVDALQRIFENPATPRDARCHILEILSQIRCPKA